MNQLFNLPAAGTCRNTSDYSIVLSLILIAGAHALHNAIHSAQSEAVVTTGGHTLLFPFEYSSLENQ